MANLQKRPDGKWRARYRDDGGRQHSRHFARKVDAQRWLDEVTASVVTGQYVDPKAGRIAFKAYAEQWLLRRCTGRRQPSTSRRCCAGIPTRHWGAAVVLDPSQ